MAKTFRPSTRNSFYQYTLNTAKLTKKKLRRVYNDVMQCLRHRNLVENKQASQSRLLADNKQNNIE